MQPPNPLQIVPLPVDRVNETDLIQRLSDESFKLRQIIDEMANALAIKGELIQQLRDEIALLKGEKPKPKIPPSKLEGPGSGIDWRKKISPKGRVGKVILFFLWVGGSEYFGTPPLNNHSLALIGDSILNVRALEISRLARPIIKRIRRIGKPGQPKGKLRKKKKAILQVHEKPVIHPKDIPAEAKFKGFNRYTVQEIIFKSCNIQYQLGRWQLPDGSYLTGELPKEVSGHYGPRLIAYVLHQYHNSRVTEHLLLEQLHALGILISAGQLNRLLIENKEDFIEEVAELLPVAARVEEQIQVDDTGGRHNGQNQYTTIIGNRWFSVFATTGSKNRVNFLKLLQNGKEEYVINEDTLDYLSQVKVSGYFPGYVSLFIGKKFTSHEEWEQFLKERNILQDSERRFLTEAALYASVIQNGIPKNLGVHSDDAGQFDVFVHSLCWVHEERHYRKLIMTSDKSRADLARVENQIWVLYRALKEYQECPNKGSIELIGKEFDDIFQQTTSSPTLNHQLEKTHRKKKELLRVLERVATPLHNNSSETCARAAKIKLKISGGTRSKLGQKVRDTFLSLKQTCLKLKINFMSYLEDRVSGRYAISRLATIICEQALSASADSLTPLSLSSLNGFPSQSECQRRVG